MRTIEQILRLRLSKRNWIDAQFEDPDKLWAMDDEELFDVLDKQIEMYIRADQELLDSASFEELKMVVREYGSELRLIAPDISNLIGGLFTKLTNPRHYYERLAIVALARMGSPD